jgi:4-diphosphocytidyl-2-C-methyl-D-erythritol kinase
MMTARHATVSVRVPAKINLDLAVGPVGPDGYHPVHTVFHAVSLYDDLTVTTSGHDGDITLEVEGEHVAGVPLDDTNLAVRAARLLAARAGLRLVSYVPADEATAEALGQFARLEPAPIA